MGIDLAVCFTERAVSVEQIIRTTALRVPTVEKVYVIMGAPQERSGRRNFFALWSDEPISLQQICKELSEEISPICIAWKSEHGGVGGYLSYRDGAEVSNIADSGNNYLLLPSEGVENTFGIALPLTPDDRYSFPELLLDVGVLCFRIEMASRRVVNIPSSTITNLMEDELDTEPVLPIDIW